VRELELKCVVDDDFVIRPERVAIPGAIVHQRRGRRVQDIYFDTADLRLARWGLTLRWREGDGWTVKLPRPSGDDQVLDRDELHLDGAPGHPPADVQALVAPFARSEPLIEVARLDNHRIARLWATPSGVPVGELVDDHVVATTADRTIQFREVEFELAAGGDRSTLRAVADSLGLDAPSATPKLARALGYRATEAPDVLIPPLPRHPRAAHVVHTAIATSVHRILTSAPIARIGTDPEGVHQTRVATRRLRSDLKTFRPLLDKAWADRLRRDLRWLADELGTVRDADVLDGHFADTLAANPEIDARGGAELRAHLASARDLDRRRLLAHLADTRAIELFDHLVDAAAAPQIRRRARKPAERMLPPLVETAWRDLRRHVDALDPIPADDDLHEIRILAKRVRYAAEAVAPALGKRAAKFAKAAADIQDSLGDLHDSAIAAEWLAHAADTGLTPPGAFAAGRVAECLRADASQHRAEWQPSYDKMHKRSGWLDKR
jgi:CHAD domain-containing protein